MFAILFVGVSNCKYNISNINRTKANPVSHTQKISLRGNKINDYSDRLDFYSSRCKLISYKAKTWIFLPNYKTQNLQLFRFDSTNECDSLRIPWDSYGETLIDNDGNTFFAFNSIRSTLDIYELKDSGFYLEGSIKLKVHDPKYVFLKRKMFEVLLNDKGTSLLISYAIHSAPKTSYRDVSANFLLLTPTYLPVKIGKYPKDYFKNMKYYYSPLFTSDKRKYIYYTFELSDSIYKIDKEGNVIKSANLNGEGFLKFNWKKEMDLSYVRQYTEETERNEKIFLLKSGNIVVLKKLPKKGILTQTQYKYIVLDSNLNSMYNDTIRHYCYPWFISDYKDGFVLLGDSLKYAHYYEVKK